MSQPFRLGFFTHLEGPGAPKQIYQETMELFIAAEALGFDAVWVAQHHFVGHPGRLPSPFPFLAAVAARTQRLRLGISIIVLPLEHPVRVAEDAAVVDTLSSERLEVGIGSGGDLNEYVPFGVAAAERFERTTASLHALQHALRGEPLGDAGQILQPPAPTLVNRLWQSAASEQGAAYVAQNGVGMLLARAAWHNHEPTDKIQLRIVERYLASWHGQPGQPRIGLSRGIYPAADRATALAEIRAGVLREMEPRIKRGQLAAGLPLEDYCAVMNLAYGHPAEIAATLAADRVLPHTTDLILQFNPIKPTLKQALRMLEQTATEIAPALGWQPAAAPSGPLT